MKSVCGLQANFESLIDLQQKVLFKILLYDARALTTFDFHRKWSYWPLQPGKQHVPLSRVSFIKGDPSLSFTKLTFHINN